MSGVGECRVMYFVKGILVYIFFFKQKTAYEIVSRDWSSDVCSSDLGYLDKMPLTKP